ncbi:MAG: hypothetical protein GC179_22150 [Anaerolineaceae bacterium]|nr:hypothetical protein [Anaerolineaceae bacterium]
MNRLNMFFTLLLSVIFVALMFFAGQPITKEADLVQQWYDTLCNPAANQSLLYIYTQRGSQTDAQLQTIIDAYRAANEFTNGCTAIENPNVIYFQPVPPELSTTVDRIKFVAVNVFAPDQTHDFNHVLSVRFGVHVLFYKNGTVKILPHFMPDSPLERYQGRTPVALYNNDGLLMGSVQLTGDLIQIPQADIVRYGVPLQFSPVHAWGSGWIRIYADDIEVSAERYADVLPAALQASFLPEFLENLPAHKETQGVVWFTLPNTGHPVDIHITVSAYQTLWDMPALPSVIKVQ